MRRIWSFLAAELITVTGLACVPAAGMAQEDRIHIPSAVVEEAPHPITFEEIITLRDPQSPAISPDGRRIAFTVRQAFMDENGYRSALYLVDADGGGTPRKILEQKALTAFRWGGDGRFLTHISAEAGGPSQVMRLDPQTERSEPLTRHATSVRSYDISGDGRIVAFTSKDSLSQEERDSLYDHGIRWEDHYYFTDVTEGEYVRFLKPVQLWAHDTATGEERKLWEHPGIESLDLSPDGKRIAVVYRPTWELRDRVNRDIMVIDVETGAAAPFVSWRDRDDRPAWSPDSRKLAFASPGDLSEEEFWSDSYRSDGSVWIHEFTQDTGRRLGPLRLYGTSLTWTADGSRILYSASDRHNDFIMSMSTVDGSTERISQGDDNLTECTFSADARRAACIRQNTMTPPEIAVLDLGTGEPRTLTNLNPEYRNIELAPVTKLDWVNKYGHGTHGYLMKPPGYAEGKRYPFIMVLYGFDNSFITQAQWISGSPVQRFTAEGFVVLMTNYPSVPGARPWGAYEDRALEAAWSPLASIEEAVDMLATDGLIDPTRTGIMGLSYGSFLTDFTMTHSKKFSVASSLDGGRENIMRYIMEGSDYWYHGDGYFGGSPFGPAIKNYKEISPALNTDKANGPILMQYAKRLGALEFYTAMRAHGKPVELVFYPDEGHIFGVPSHRLTSMEQNLDWFRFWLKGEEDPDPGKRAQYERWRAMR